MLTPRNLEELVPASHKVGMVDAAIEEMKLDPLLSHSERLAYAQRQPKRASRPTPGGTSPGRRQPSPVLAL